MDTYINTLDGFITIFLSGVIHKGTLLLQEHLDAVDGPSSEREKGASVEMIDELTTSLTKKRPSNCSDHILVFLF